MLNRFALSFALAFFLIFADPAAGQQWVKISQIRSAQLVGLSAEGVYILQDSCLFVLSPNGDTSAHTLLSWGTHTITPYLCTVSQLGVFACEPFEILGGARLYIGALGVGITAEKENVQDAQKSTYASYAKDILFLGPRELSIAGEAEVDEGHLGINREQYNAISQDLGNSWAIVGNFCARRDSDYEPFSLGAFRDVAVQRDGSRVAVSGHSILRSMDRGAHWDTCGAVPNSIIALAAMKDNSVIGACSNSILRSTDNGVSWADMSAGLDGTDTISPGSLISDLSGYCYLSCTSGVYRSASNFVESVAKEDRAGRALVWPSPASRVVHFDFNQTFGDAEVVDMQGNVVRTCGEGCRFMDISILPNGVYTIIVHGPSTVNTVPLLVVH